jgi:hypothetical protein
LPMSVVVQAPAKIDNPTVTRGSQKR